MGILWLDTETYSECDLKAHGTHRYAEHPSTEIIVAQWAVDDGEPNVEDLTGKQRPSGALLSLLGNPNYQIRAHNAVFDRTLIRHCWGLDIPVERWYCTMIQAMAHGLPGALGKIGEVMGLEADAVKDKRGAALIQIFCKPAPKGQKVRRKTGRTHPVEWAEFLEYSRQDVPAMRNISRVVPTWNFRDGHPELAMWRLDQRINDRGFAVDVDLAEAAIEAVAVEQKRLKAEMAEATDGEVTNASRRDQLLAYILSEYEVELPDMKADTLRRRMNDPELPEGVKLLISIRLESTKTSTAKYKALVKAVSADGRLRNTLQFAGAQRTMRWAGRIFQPQNMPRPNMSQVDIDEGVSDLLARAAPLFWDDVMRLTANTVRGCIVAAPGKKLCIADLANIEGRMLAWLAGEAWKLDAFSAYDAGTGPDLYKLAYARSFNVDPETATGQKRQIGKVQELGLGYGGGVAAFLTFAAVYEMDLQELAESVFATAGAEALKSAEGMWTWAQKKKRTLGLAHDVYVACEILKAAWREAHPMTAALWSNVELAVRKAIGSPGQVFRVRSLAVRVDGAWLRIRLPSGRYLCYLQPQIGKNGEISYMGVSQYTRQWTRLKTYGGKLVENVTQAAARDVLAESMPLAEAAGYPIVLSVHDELLTETPDTDEFSHTALAEIMSTVPAWAPGLPLSAAGFETNRYRKG